MNLNQEAVLRLFHGQIFEPTVLHETVHAMGGKEF